MNEQYKEVDKHLKLVCESLRWPYKENPEISETYDLGEGSVFGFSIDNVDYLIAIDPNAEDEGYYASVLVQYHGNRYEPPSEDEKVLPGDNTKEPSGLISRILDAHWSLRKQWALESCHPEY